LQTTRNAAFKAALLAGGAGLVAIAQPAFAQDGQPVPTKEPVQSDPASANQNPAGQVTDQDAGEPQGNQGIVVTGSRIVRQDYQSTSPLVTVDKTLLQQSSTAAIEQNLNKLPQFTPAKTPTGGGDIQPTATNTPGAATVSLRGLGANRNLVLLDGRRATPSNAAGIVDINTIPSAAVERVEIISGGASATYGADAVAGVTNFILKKNFQGLEVDGQFSTTQHGDGNEYQVSGIMGSDFDDGRGNVSIAMSYNKREPVLQRDRSWYRNIWEDPTTGAGGRFFPLYPGVALGFNGTSTIPGTTGYDVFYNQLFPGTVPNNGANGQPLPNTIAQTFASIYTIPGTNVLFTTGRGQQGGIKFFEQAGNQGLQQGDLAVRNATNSLKFVDTTPYLILPLSRWNMFMRGNYELNDWIGVFAQGLYSSTTTHTTQQGGAIVGGWDVFVPYGTGVYTGSANQATAYGSMGIPSSVILNGMALNGGLGGTGPFYTDNTPGDLTDNPTNPVFRQLYGNSSNAVLAACAQSATGGCTNNQAIGQFFPQAMRTLLDNRVNPNGRVELNYGFPENRSVTNRVTTADLLAGFEGTIPGTDWSYQVFGDHGSTTTYTRQTGVWSMTRLRTLLMSPGFGLGLNTNSNLASGRPNFGANFASCTTGMNIFTLSWDQISDDCKKAITADLKNNSKVTQTIWEADATGTLFEMPAGPLKAALGASYRKLSYEFINDTVTNQGESFLDQANGIYPSSDSFGSYNVKELYGELDIPILKDIPAIKSLDLWLGGRISDYNTTGTSYTYKIQGDWQITSWLRARGGYNRAERAPNIAELYQASSQIFGFNSLGDLCSERATYRISAGAGGSLGADIKATCAAVMNNTGGPGAAAGYYTQRQVSAQPAAGGGFAWTNATGNPNLKPEVADTWTAGIVVQSPFSAPALSRLRFTVDWYSIKLKDAIGLQGAGTALQQCLDPYWNPAVTGAAAGTVFSPIDPNTGTVTVGSAAQAAAASPYCKGIRYDPPPVNAAANFDVTYYNNGRVDISGIDGQLDYSVDIGPGTFSLNALVNYYLHYKSTELADNPLVDYSGTLGTAQNALNPGAFRYRTLVTVGYTVGPFGASLQWQHLPKVKQESAALFPTTISGYPAYDLFSLRGTYQALDNVQLRFGVDNLFNTKPPLGGVNSAANISLGQNPGGGFNGQFYDTNGRRFFVGANLKF
jgi:outer membrane receptor protein involved in Fe transport